MTKAEVIAQIESRNEEFASASYEQKRRMLAQDVLDILQCRAIYASHAYISADGDESDMSIRNALSGYRGVQCNCCAIGALWMTHVLHTDTEQTLWNHSRFSSGLIRDMASSGFSAASLISIENAYERQKMDGIYHDDIDKSAIAFGERYAYDTDRIIAIMNNIIEHDDFHPEAVCA